MPPSLTLLLGDAGAGKTERLLSEYRQALGRGRQRRRPGTALWLAPTHRAQQAITARLMESGDPVQFAPGVMTFDLFAEEILAAAGQPATPMSPVMKRLLLRRIVADLAQRGQLVNFSSVTQTTGFLDVISSFISELKREEIWPVDFLEACEHQPPRRAKRDRELGLIYQRYQDHLEKQNWYDNEGRFWLARNALKDNVRGPFANVEFLAVDGFADFTQTQYEILGKLMEWIPEAKITLPAEQPLTRLELFDKPRSTVDHIRKHLPAATTVKQELLTADRSRWPAALRSNAESLFMNPRKIVPSQAATGLEIIAATGQLGEFQAVALRIKRLLLSGVAASQIVVAVRSVSDAGPAWRDYLTEAGIPNWCEAGTPLINSPIVKALFSVLQLELEDWPFARLTQVLGSNYFQPAWPELQIGHGVRAVGTALRRLKLHAGRDLILRVLGRVRAGTIVDDNVDEFSANTRAATAALAKSSEAILKRLVVVTERLRKKATLSDWGDVIASLGRELGWLNLGEKTKSIGAASDRADWDLFQRILRTAGEADQQLASSGDPKPLKQTKLDLAGFTAELRDLLGAEQIKAAGDPGGTVRILDVEQVRHLDVPHLFVVGLSESSFPLNRGDDCLFGEAERKEFARRGLPMKHRELHQRDEMFLFYSVVTRARAHLTLSYPAVNSKGQPVFASPYLMALRSLFDPRTLAVAHEGQLDPIPELDRALTDADLRLLSVSEARVGNPGLFAALGRRPGWLQAGLNILAAIEVNTQRFHQRGFTGYEGRLENESNLVALRQRFGSRHQFSATELEGYANCPFRFWMGSVLKVDDLVTPEEGTDYAARGSLVHAVLAEMLREGLEKPAEVLAERFRELVEEHLSKRIHETDLQRALTRIEQELLTLWGDAFAHQQTEYAEQLDEAWTGGVSALPPEIPFGSLPDAEAAGDVTSPPLVFGSENNTVQVRGRIDRVDTGFTAGKRVFNVIDYKTGSPPTANQTELETGRSIQLALYALAVRRLGIADPDADPYQMGYWSLRATGFKRGYQRHKAKLEPMDLSVVDALEQTLDSVIPQLAEGIRAGKFLVENADENCTGHCPYHTTCRVNQIRPLVVKLNKVGDILNNHPTARVED